jgi:hypothetical protein
VASNEGHALLDAIGADGPIPELADELRLFGQFVGSWRLDWRGAHGAGAGLELPGELHFGWVLGGRAIQDVWIVPSPRPALELPPGVGFHGSTLRFYDPALGAWRSTWIEPVNGRVRCFVGRPDGADICLTSDEEAPALRWRFTAVTPTSFTWIGEISDDGGRTYVRDEEMRATRA